MEFAFIGDGHIAIDSSVAQQLTKANLGTDWLAMQSAAGGCKLDSSSSISGIRP